MHPDLLQRATRMDFANYLAEDILVKVDRASMLNSLELRAPLLDYRLIEFAFGKVPSHLKATAQDKKILLKRLRAHAAICFMALILYRVMRSRLRQSETQLSPERALAKLRRIQHQRITLNTQPIAGLSSITQEHTDILTALTIKKPTMNAQLTLL
jgi:asparagine synthetase B (glutamine-hydrolysing)